MSAGSTTERVLIALRQHLTGSDMKPGARLEPAQLAQRLGASLTPVREALHLLTGEGLVESRPTGGFNLPFLDAGGLHDRYEWSAQLLTLAVRTWPRRRRKGEPTLPSPSAGSIADRCARLFLHIGQLSSNAEHARVLSMLNARLHHVRLAEEGMIERLDDELQALAAAIDAQDRSAVMWLIDDYHKKRKKITTEIIDFIYRKN